MWRRNSNIIPNNDWTGYHRMLANLALVKVVALCFLGKNIFTVISFLYQLSLGLKILESNPIKPTPKTYTKTRVMKGKTLSEGHINLYEMKHVYPSTPISVERNTSQMKCK